LWLTDMLEQSDWCCDNRFTGSLCLWVHTRSGYAGQPSRYL